MDDREERIRARAYELWEAAGRPQGQEAEHWAEAERQVDSEIGDAGVNPDQTGPAQPDEVERVDAEVPVVRKKRASARPKKTPPVE